LGCSQLTIQPNFAKLQHKLNDRKFKLRNSIGQEEAIKSIYFGLKMDDYGYNIFCVGDEDTNMEDEIQNIVKEYAKKQKDGLDWCYVYNFKEPESPILLSFKPGEAVKFAQKIKKLVEEYKVCLNKELTSLKYDRSRRRFIEYYLEIKNSLLSKLSELASSLNLTISLVDGNFEISPLIEGKKITSEVYEKLDKQKKEEIEENSARLLEFTYAIINRISQEEKNVYLKLGKLENAISRRIIEQLLSPLKDEYNSNPEIIAYLEEMGLDLVKHSSLFRITNNADLTQVEVIDWSKREFIRYKVNVLVTSQPEAGAPVIFEKNPTYSNLFGKIEFISNDQYLVTDFTKIKAGSVHLANGGYLILNAREVLRELGSWEGLERILKSKLLKIESLSNRLGFSSLNVLTPQPLPLNLKVIMFGEPKYYYLLNKYSEEFSDLFKVKAEFKDNCPLTEESCLQLAEYAIQFCRRNGGYEINIGALDKLIVYSSRLAGSQKKITARLKLIRDILKEAIFWASIDDRAVLKEEHLTKSWSEMNRRKGQGVKFYNQLILDNKILLDVKGGKIGQVNAISILDFGDYRFGIPLKITASTWKGTKGVINIERESELSGKIHNKASLILAGYLKEKYGQKMGVNFSASICLEQSYGLVDGDSASLAELYAIISSLSGLHLDQGIAVTGSINQKGEVQPVGGINEKIEGFYDVCQAKGLTGYQGVIIPFQNIDDLLLKDQVINAVERGMFHIFPITEVDEGLEILTKVQAGSPDFLGNYPPGTVHHFVMKKLKEYANNN